MFIRISELFEISSVFQGNFKGVIKNVSGVIQEGFKRSLKQVSMGISRGFTYFSWVFIEDTMVFQGRFKEFKENF